MSPAFPPPSPPTPSRAAVPSIPTKGGPPWSFAQWPPSSFFPALLPCWRRYFSFISNPVGGNGTPIGIGFFVGGLFMLIDCTRSFLLAGNGTMAPWDPPKRLVVHGMYRFIRNPMYIGILLFVFGFGLLHGSKLVIAYDIGLWIAFQIRLKVEEEPRLALRFGENWFRYRRHVRRWIPRFSPWQPRPAPVPVSTKPRDPRHGN